MRGSWWFLVLLAVPTALVGCGGDDTSNPSDTTETSDSGEGGADGDAEDAAAEDGPVDEGGAECPGAPPPGNACTSPGQTCEYVIPGCGTMYCECMGGYWSCLGGHDCDAGTDADADVPDVPPDVEPDVLPDVEPDVVLPDVPGDVPGDGGRYPRCESRGGTCTEFRWEICPIGTEPAATEGHEDCPAGGWCCVPAPDSSCSSSGYTNCVEGERCTGCWGDPGVTGLFCEAGRVCCFDICD